MFTLLVILAVIYVFLKVSNTRAEFAEHDAEREAQERAAAEQMEELAEEDEIRRSAIDVEADVYDASGDGSETIFDVETANSQEEEESMWV